LLWNALSAWRSAGYGPAPVVAAWQQRAKDPHTKELLERAIDPDSDVGTDTPVERPALAQHALGGVPGGAPPPGFPNMPELPTTTP